MQVVCNNCKAKYRIADEKLKGRKRIRLRCKVCENIIEVPLKLEEDSNSLFSTTPRNAVTDIVNSDKKNSGDIFEDNLFSSAGAEEFSYEDAKSTLVLDRNLKAPIEDNKNREPEVKFKSNFQIDFSDKTNQYDVYKQQKEGPRNSAAVSFETTQQLSIEKFNEYQRQNGNQTVELSQKMGENTDFGKIDNETQRKFDKIAGDFSESSEKGSGILKFLFSLILVVSLFLVFVLYRNNWKLDVNNIPEMIEVAFGNKIKLPKEKKIVKKEKPLSEQFFIDPKKVKTDLFKFSKRRKDKRYILTVSGEIKNIDSKKKSLTTVRVILNRISDKKNVLDKRVYAGNVFTRKEIRKAKNEENLDAEYLQSGKNGINWGVLPGKTVPFMVVFWLDKKINIKKYAIKIEIVSTQ